MRGFWRHEDEGAAAMEYAILASMVAAVIASVVFAVGQRTLVHFSQFLQAF